MRGETMVETVPFVPAGQGAVEGARDIFNSTVASFAIAGAWEVGALDALRDRGVLDVDEFCAEHDLHLPSITSMFVALSAVGVTVHVDRLIRPGPVFDEVYRGKAFFHWLTVGCGELFSNMANIVRNQRRVGRFYRRNAVAIGFACRDVNLHSFDPAFWGALAALDFELTTIADLGCGSGARLVEIATRYPGSRGVGLDIAPEAVRDATEYARSAGLGDRLTYVEADARAVEPDQRYESVEVLTCFMMGHDFWPREQCVASLRQLRRAFPNVRRFLLGDTGRTDGIPAPEKPIFNMAFEYAHDLMGVYLPTLAEWEGVFEEGGWECVKAHPVAMPTETVIYELA
jgi:SAM-dependent methyltransferase